MGFETNLHLRGRVYYLRLSVPKHLRELRRARGKRAPAALWKSLGTSDPAVARMRLCEEKARLLDAFAREADRLRGGLDTLRSPRAQIARESAPIAERCPTSSHISVNHQRALSASESVPSQASTAVKRGERLVDWFERYLAEEHAGVVGRTLRDKRATVKRFVEIAGNKPVQEYTQADVSAFKRALLKCPANVERLFPGKKLSAAIVANERVGHALLAPNTVNNKLSTMAAFGAWLECNANGVSADHFQTTPVRDKRPDRRMAPFTDAEILAILNAPAFTGCESERNQAKPGDYKIRDWRYWIPRIAAYTGARLGEVAQLRCDDITKQDGLWVIQFTDEAVGQSLKTRSSRRTVPMHSKLVRMGLPALADRASCVGQEWLFVDVPVDNDGRRSTAAGKWFRKFLTRLGLRGDGKRGGMHRFRHTVVTQLRDVGYADHDIAPLVGHGVELARMTSKYGAQRGRRAHAMKEIVESVGRGWALDIEQKAE